jgi:hypothetical protein
MKRTNNDQTVMDNAGGARVEVNINTNEPKKKGGFKRGAVVGTLGGIFLGGAGVAYAIENEITMNDVKEGINDIMEDVNRGIEAATNGDSTSEKTATNETSAEQTAANETPADEVTVGGDEQSTDETPVGGDEQTTGEAPATGDERLTGEEVVDALKDSVNNEEVPVEEDERLTGEEVVDALKGATADDVVEDDDFVTIETPDMIVNIDESISIAESVNDDMTFDEAFAAARAEVGAGGAFEWRGGVYGTYYAEEWESMSAEEKAEFGDQFEFIAADEAEPEPIDVTVDELLAAEDEVVAVPEPAVDPEPEIEVEVDNVYHVEDAHGNEASFIEVAVDGEDVHLVDEDGDGVIDVMVYDENGDGVIDEAEMFDVSEEGLMVEDFVEMVEEPAADDLMPADDVITDDLVDDDVVADDAIM